MVGENLAGDQFGKKQTNKQNLAIGVMLCLGQSHARACRRCSASEQFGHRSLSIIQLHQNRQLTKWVAKINNSLQLLYSLCG